MNLGGRFPWKITAHDRLMIWVRYQLWHRNRPATIAHDYDVSVAYVTKIGKSNAHSPTRRALDEGDPQPLHLRPSVAPTK